MERSVQPLQTRRSPRYRPAGQHPEPQRSGADRGSGRGTAEDRRISRRGAWRTYRAGRRRSGDAAYFCLQPQSGRTLVEGSENRCDLRRRDHAVAARRYGYGRPGRYHA
ncbi:MAG: hypothetical protein COV67_14140, partial [Nitrospinae bacterium CG11_big_fil_rev_8_21_14_0_20_56_8]